MSLEFTDPPVSHKANARTDWYEIAAALRQRAGEWAVIRKNDEGPGLAYRVRSGTISAFRPNGTFEAVSRRSDNGDGWDIYARYAGEATR